MRVVFIKFEKWLKSKTYNDEQNVMHIIQDITNAVMELVKKNNFKIIDENELRNDIANFIYNRS